MGLKSKIAKSLASLVIVAALAGTSGCDEKPKEHLNPTEIATVKFDQLKDSVATYNNSTVGYFGKLKNVRYFNSPVAKMSDYVINHRMIIDFTVENDAGRIPSKTVAKFESTDSFAVFQEKVEQLERDQTRVRVVGRYENGYLQAGWIEKDGKVYINLSDKIEMPEVIRGQGTIEDMIYVQETKGSEPMPDKLILQVYTDSKNEIILVYKGLKLDAAKVAQLTNKHISFVAEKGPLSAYSPDIYSGIKLE